MFKRIAIMVIVLLWSGLAFAAHPLITDDTGTQGKGRFQFELNGGYSNDNGNKETEVNTILSAGLRDNIDLVITAPYLFQNIEDGSSEDGISDIGIEMKWRFYEKDGLSFALKPGIILPTGNENKGLGDGKTSYSLFFIATKEIEPLTIDLNLGYIKNRKDLRDIWHYSLAGEYRVTKPLRIVANIGGETNPDKESDINPAFLLGGIIYSVNENFDVDCGIKAGLPKQRLITQSLQV